MTDQSFTPYTGFAASHAQHIRDALGPLYENGHVPEVFIPIDDSTPSAVCRHCPAEWLLGYVFAGGWQIMKWERTKGEEICPVLKPMGEQQP